jgi:hypothetical protein
MNSDIRIKSNILTNPKIKKFVKEVGEIGIIKLLRLWLFTAEHRPKGILYDISDDDLREILGYSAGSLADSSAESDNQLSSNMISAQLKYKFIEKDKKGVYSVHDWSEHNPYAFFAPERSEQAKRASLSRHNIRTSAQTSNQLSSKRKSAKLKHQISSAPSPIPSPAPKGKEKNYITNGNPVGLGAAVFPKKTKQQIIDDEIYPDLNDYDPLKKGD